MSTTTRKSLIIKRFIELESNLKTHIDANLFPSLEDYSTADMIYYITLVFMGVQTDDQYREKVKDLACFQNVVLKDETVDIILPLIKEFIEWLRAV